MHACSTLELREVAPHDWRVHSGQRIKQAREEALLGQRDVAEALGVSVSTVSNWERGKTVPRSRRAALEKLLDLTSGEVANPAESRPDPTLTAATDMQLAMEFFRRLQNAKRRSSQDPSTLPTVPNGYPVPWDEDEVERPTA